MNRTEDPRQAHQAAALNGEIVSESESDHPDDFLDNDRVKAILKKKIQAIRRKCRRDRMKLVAQKRFLQRKGLVESLLPILISERPLKITWRKEVLAPMHGGTQEFLLYQRHSCVSPCKLAT